MSKVFSLMMTARQIVHAMRFLSNDGIDPASGRRILSASLAGRVALHDLTDRLDLSIF